MCFAVAGFNSVFFQRFAAVIMRIREPRTTALIFSSGKMVCTGAKSEEKSKLAARKYARVVQKLGFPAKFSDFQIQNMVGSVDVKFPIRLEGLVLTHGQFSRLDMYNFYWSYCNCEAFKHSTQYSSNRSPLSSC